MDIDRGLSNETDALIRAALAEDLAAAGDVTSQATLAVTQNSAARFVARKPGVLCGVHIAARVCALIDPHLKFAIQKQDGSSLQVGDTLADVQGLTRSLLRAERVALNFLTLLSGVATLTRAYVDAVAGTKARIVDTRKTIPAYRALQKYAVRMGGGYNHRMGLYDQVLIKDNHIAAVGSAGEAVRRAKARYQQGMKIEVEIDRLDQIADVLDARPDIIMLDNFSIEDMGKAVAQINGRAIVEASGGVTLERVRAIALTGVDIISVGALTHSAPALDIALDF